MSIKKATFDEVAFLLGQIKCIFSFSDYGVK